MSERAFGRGLFKKKPYRPTQTPPLDGLKFGIRGNYDSAEKRFFFFTNTRVSRCSFHNAARQSATRKYGLGHFRVNRLRRFIPFHFHKTISIKKQITIETTYRNETTEKTCSQNRLVKNCRSVRARAVFRSRWPCRKKSRKR